MESRATVQKPSLRPASVAGSSGRSTPPTKRVPQTGEPSGLRRNRISSPPTENRPVTGPSVSHVYIADTNNNRIRRVSPPGVITTVAGTGTAGAAGDGGPATSAQLRGPRRIAIDRMGNLFIPDAANHRIRMVATNGSISTIAGNGTAGFNGDGGLATLAQLNLPEGVAVDDSGNVFIADLSNHRVRKLTPIQVAPDVV